MSESLKYVYSKSVIDNEDLDLSKLNELEKWTLELLYKAFGTAVNIRSLDSSLPGTPDFVLRNEGSDNILLCVFVDGSFWHNGRSSAMQRLALRHHASGEIEKAQFWLEKASENKTRDRGVNKSLKEMGLAYCRLKEDRLNGRDSLGYVASSVANAIQRVALARLKI